MEKCSHVKKSYTAGFPCDLQLKIRVSTSSVVLWYAISIEGGSVDKNKECYALVEIEKYS